ncbi:flagellar filament capping protein FliD [uncultured Clostridium sp.]|uniref:flagellar filament capping protein FliD n=1 Tax=uncultured Clostridium sp. TaxID=59620 RepID=UPI0025DBCE79|nr:flagellar filament capping protein FliD [uncultured Clostridium sp.]
MASNRITGTNSGIDVDAVVKASLTTEQNKIDKAYQQQKIYEYQQEQLKEIVKECTSFYDKYLDILSNDSMLKSSAYESVSFTSSNNNVTAKGFAGADAAEYSVNITKLASKATTTLRENDFDKIINSDKKNGVLSVQFDNNGTKVEANIDVVIGEDKKVDLAATASKLSDELKAKGINVTAKYSEISGGIVLESAETGASQKFSIAIEDGTTKDFDSTKASYKEHSGNDVEGKITKNNVEYTIKSSSNTFTVDNIQFTLNKEGETVLTGKNDSSKLKENIVNFINDYNTLIQKINDKLLEKRDTDYMPLTDAQKEEMKEDEIKKWEEKAQTGLLKNDSDLQRIQSALKSTMRTLMSDSGLNLEAIGIKPVDNYGSKNGTFTIDESKLSAAIENNAEGVKDLFIKAADSKADKNKNGGILTQLQSVLKSEIKLSTSSLSKRIGFSGTSTEKNNTLTTYISKQKKLITELKEKYTTKETALYKKYSSLETMLEKLNAQSNSLYSMLNIG